VPLEPPDQQYWQAAVGYVELGMFQDANAELEKIDPFNRAAPEVLSIRLAIYRGLEKSELMQQIAKRLKEFQPDNIQWTISLAYATNGISNMDAFLTDREGVTPKTAGRTFAKVGAAVKKAFTKTFAPKRGGPAPPTSTTATGTTAANECFPSSRISGPYPYSPLANRESAKGRSRAHARIINHIRYSTPRL
jgi:hypothetical protein